MTPDEARKLLGGYATGSLTEAERTALFQTALEDQELFDELAGEQVLQEVLDEPGARQRLLAALESGSHQGRWWMQPWSWAAVATVAIGAVIGIVVSQRTPPPPPQQIAQVLKSPEPLPAPVAPTPVPAPLRQKAATEPPPPPAPAPEPPADIKKEESTAVAEQVDQLQKAQVQAGTGVRGFVAAAPQAARARSANAVTVASFEFTYAVSPNGFLQITPAAPGFLSVSANDAAVFPTAAVPAGAPVRIQIPPAASSLEIGFSRAPGIAGSPIRRDALTGRETDQDPPNGRILIQLSLTPATR